MNKIFYSVIKAGLYCCRLKAKLASGRPIGGKTGRRQLFARAMMVMTIRSSIPSTKCRRPSDPCSIAVELYSIPLPVSVSSYDAVTSSASCISRYVCFLRKRSCSFVDNGHYVRYVILFKTVLCHRLTPKSVMYQ